MKTFLATVAALAGLVPAAAQPRRELLGRTYEGRALSVLHVGDPSGPRVLVFGCIHGNECAGVAVVRALARMHPHADLWLVTTINPDGRAHNIRQNSRGVDLNRNWPAGWLSNGTPFDTYYGGPAPFSERETRIARRLIVRLQPALTVWFHQHMNLVWAYGHSSAAGRAYAHASGMRFYHHPDLPGTSTRWQNRQLRTGAAITVELPAGSLSRGQARRHARAVLSTVRRTARWRGESGEDPAAALAAWPLGPAGGGRRLRRRPG